MYTAVRRLRGAWCGLILSATAWPLSAGERELASEGKAVRLSIDKAYQCGQSAKVTITTASAAYFDQDAATIQRLSDTSRAILGFECPRIARIEFVGVTAGMTVYMADAEKSNKWRLESFPAPLEGAALLFSLKQPSFLNLGLLAGQIKPYESVPGFAETYQYKAWQTQMRTQASVGSGNVEAFQEYLKEPGSGLGSFEHASTHFENIVSAFKSFVPERYAVYKKAYDDLAPSLRQEYWSTQFAGLFDEDFSVASITTNALKLIAASPTPEFASYLDSEIAEWMRAEAEGIKSDLPEATLLDLSWARDYLAGFPQGAGDLGKLPQTAGLASTLPGDLSSLVAQRLSALQELAIATVRESGVTYAEVNDILETGFALSGEFEENGYDVQGQAVLEAAFQHIETVLRTDLPAYKQQLAAMSFTASSAEALQVQIVEFEALGEEFPGFVAYKEAAQGALETNRRTICASVLSESGASKQDESRAVQVGSQTVTLAKMSCDMFANGHMLITFKNAGKPGEAQITIRDEEGDEVTHVLSQQGRALAATARLDGKPVTPDSWESYAQGLMRPPANGKPDAKGVRDCDRLAADPDDPKKLARGVDFNKAGVSPVDFDRAIEACIAAVDDAPSDPRQQFQLGRLLAMAGDADGANEYLDLGIAGGYGAAMYHKAEHLLISSDDQNAFVDALEFFGASAKAGYPRGAAMVKELNPEGAEFYRQIPAPTPQEIIAALPLREAGQSFLGVSSSFKIVDVGIKECFQVNATDFACEYRPVLKCGISAARPDAMTAFMSRLVQADCDSAGYQFNTFRMVSDGKWQRLPDQ